MTLFTALGLLFIALKLMGQIDWSWALVLLPIYGGFVLVFGLLFVAALLGVKVKK